MANTATALKLAEPSPEESVARWVDMQVHADSRGMLAIGECGKQIPFDIKRVYYSYRVPEGSDRAGHGHRTLQQVIIPVAGSFILDVDDGVHKDEFLMNDPARGVYIPAMRWRKVRDYSADAVCLVLASGLYDPSEYIKDYDAFVKEVLG